MNIRELKSLPQTLTMATNGNTFDLIYARKSTVEDSRQVSSIPDQVKILTPLATNLIATFKESGSAKDTGRIEFNKMIQLLESRDDIKIFAQEYIKAMSESAKYLESNFDFRKDYHSYYFFTRNRYAIILVNYELYKDVFGDDDPLLTLNTYLKQYFSIESPYYIETLKEFVKFLCNYNVEPLRVAIYNYFFNILYSFSFLP